MDESNGAWESGVFDNGRDFQHPAKVPGAPPPSASPAMYNIPAVGSEATPPAVSIISIVLRSLTLTFNIISFAIIASNEGSNYDYTWRTLNSTSWQYVLAINVIVSIYSIVQLILSITNMVRNGAALSGPTQPASFITFMCDQVLTYMLMAGFGAGVGHVMSFYDAVSGTWNCGGVDEFCMKNKATAAVTFLAFVCIALSANLQYLRVHKLAAK